MTGETLNIVQDQLEKLKQLFPETIAEGKIDWEKLHATLGKENIEFSNERYVLNWAGKSEAFKVLQQTTTATLKPVPEESINFDTTENVFIEGENLEVLKVLQKSYYGKVKVVCIDPPYNTGNDSFIYPDSFKESKEEYQKRIGEKDEEGYLMKEGFFRKNSKDSGHYHSNWLSMMYPRLFLAKNLLRDDGVIFVHIDDNEVHNLRMIMNEIFGEENFVAQIVWQKSKKGDAKLIATIHEYVLVFTKNKTLSIENGTWRIKKEGADDVLDQYNKFRNEFKNDHTLITMAMQKWYNSLPKNDCRNNHRHYKVSDDRGLYFPADFAGPDDGRSSRPRYDIIHPITGKPCKKPSTGWRWDESRTKEALALNPPLIHFGEDETTIPCRKSYLKDIDTEPFSSVFYRDGRSATLQIEELVGKGVFSFPKNTEVLQDFLKLTSDEDDIILDFFGGSGTTAQAVLEQNKNDGGNRKFILVQLPEPCDEESEAFKAGYKTIADISKERIRRVIKRLNHDLPDLKINPIEEKDAQQKLFTEKENPVNQINHANPGSDNGFKVFKLSSSSFKIWRGSEITDENLEQQLELFTDPVREGSEKENMLYELILKAGYLLTDSIEYKNKLYYVKGGELILALEEINQKIIDTILTPAPLGRAGAGLQKVITLDQLFTGNDQLKTNAVLQMKDAEIDFKTI
jgi:adenine-specific DNA-methyltransferase